MARLKHDNKNLTPEQYRQWKHGGLCEKTVANQDLDAVFRAEIANNVYTKERGYTAFQVAEITAMAEAMTEPRAWMAFIQRYMSPARQRLGVKRDDDVLKRHATDTIFWMSVLNCYFFERSEAKKVAA